MVLLCMVIISTFKACKTNGWVGMWWKLAKCWVSQGGSPVRGLSLSASDKLRVTILDFAGHKGSVFPLTMFTTVYFLEKCVVRVCVVLCGSWGLCHGEMFVTTVCMWAYVGYFVPYAKLWGSAWAVTSLYQLISVNMKQKVRSALKLRSLSHGNTSRQAVRWTFIETNSTKKLHCWRISQLSAHKFLHKALG